MNGDLPMLNARPNFREKVADVIREKAERRHAADFGVGWRMHHAALEILANFVDQLDHMRDRRLVILGDVQQIRQQLAKAADPESTMRANDWDPSSNQQRVLATLATAGGEVPPPDRVLQELCAAGVRDLVEAMRRRSDHEHQRTAGAHEEIDKLTIALQESQDKLGEAHARDEEVDALRAELRERDKTIAELREMVEATTPAPEEPAAPVLDVEAVFDAVEKGLGRLLSDAEVDAIGEAVTEAPDDADADKFVAQLVERFKAPPAPAKQPKRSRRRGKASTSKEVV